MHVTDALGGALRQRADSPCILCGHDGPSMTGSELVGSIRALRDALESSGAIAENRVIGASTSLPSVALHLTT